MGRGHRKPFILCTMRVSRVIIERYYQFSLYPSTVCPREENVSTQNRPVAVDLCVDLTGVGEHVIPTTIIAL